MRSNSYLAYIQRHRSERLCIHCDRKAVVGHSSCKHHMYLSNKQTKERRERYNARNLCLMCGGTRVGRTSCCLKHWFGNAAYNQLGTRTASPILEKIWNAQNGRCAYTGVRLKPGDNACVDHKRPRSRGGKDIPNNLQWVTKKINRIKNNCTHSEFIHLCHKIASRFPLD